MIPIIVDSNVLHGTGRSRSVPSWFAENAPPDLELVITDTVQAEVSMIAADAQHEERQRFDGALTDLRTLEVDVSGISFPSDRTRPFAVSDALSDVGFRVRVLPATTEDLREAFRRSALHLPPRVNRGEDEQTRDQLIWMQALRVAREQPTGAILVSSDKIFTTKLEQEARWEARDAGLIVRRSLGRAFALAQGHKFWLALLVEANWDALREEIPTLSQNPEVRDLMVSSQQNVSGALSAISGILTLVTEDASEIEYSARFSRNASGEIVSAYFTPKDHKIVHLHHELDLWPDAPPPERYNSSLGELRLAIGRG